MVGENQPPASRKNVLRMVCVRMMCVAIVGLCCNQIGCFFTSASSRAGTRSTWEYSVAWAYAKDLGTAWSGDGYTSMHGEQQWVGSYRGVDLTLWSRVTNQRYEYTENPAGICGVGIVLCTDQRASEDEPAKKGGGVDQLVFLAEQCYEPDELCLFGLVSDPSVRPVYVQTIDSDAMDVTVYDMGGGILGYTMNIDPSGRVRILDLEDCLSNYTLSGPRKIEGACPYRCE
jgi:hypothetical protein